MLASVEGIYRQGYVELREVPGNLPEGSRVIVTFLDTKTVDLQTKGIDEKQANDLRTRLSVFAEDWDSPEMAIYDDYDAAKDPR